jgi:predicted RNA-binding protein with PUA-like domain
VSFWLVKTEPGEFAWDDLLRAGREPWDGVRNRAAQNHIAAMRPGDLALFYHTGKERQAVGICRVVSAPYPEPGQDDPLTVVVDVEPVRALPRPVPLAEIKADPAFADWALVRQARLSVMPVPEPHWRRVLAMAGDSGA